VTPSVCSNCFDDKGYLTMCVVNVINVHLVCNRHIQAICKATLGTIDSINVVGLVFMIGLEMCDSSLRGATSSYPCFRIGPCLCRPTRIYWAFP
jgi:hypothetical protein